ncbi:MAG: helix-turn-helix domain-containing protein [Bermanella sp.]
MKRIYIYAPENVVEMSIALMKDLCWVASSYRLMEKGIEGDAKDWVKLVSLNGEGVTSFSGNHISTDLKLADVQFEDTQPHCADAILLGAYWGQTDTILEQNQALSPWLIKAQQHQVPIAAVSNAPFFLAQAGLLNNKTATVYPPVQQAFAQRFPKVLLRPQSAITDAGQIFCANGIASGCDLIVSIIEQIYGPIIARRISEEFLLGFNRSYTVANMGFDGQKYHQDNQILTAQQYLERHFHESLSIQTIAQDIGMSPRNFSRRFKHATGDNPSEYLQRVRIEVAKELLRTTSLSVAEIAHKAGFSDASYFSRTFNRYAEMKPNQYRKVNSA